MATTLKVTLTIDTGTGKAKTFILKETAKAVKNDKTGKTSLAHFQPEAANTIVPAFSKVYIDTVALKAAK